MNYKILPLGSKHPTTSNLRDIFWFHDVGCRRRYLATTGMGSTVDTGVDLSKFAAKFCNVSKNV